MTPLSERLAELSGKATEGDWAELGMELHSWLLPHLGTTQMEAAQLGWQDYRDQEKQS